MSKRNEEKQERNRGQSRVFAGLATRAIAQGARSGVEFATALRLDFIAHLGDKLCSDPSSDAQHVSVGIGTTGIGETGVRIDFPDTNKVAI